MAVFRDSRYSSAAPVDAQGSARIRRLVLSPVARAPSSLSGSPGLFVYLQVMFYGAVNRGWLGWAGWQCYEAVVLDEGMVNGKRGHFSPATV
jgi:hypothetical protein